ncbi:MAG TPA: acetylornithine/succinylornithine family transaminase [Polyangiaceae bacterium]
MPSNHLMNLTTRPAAVMVRGEGSYLWDAAGRRYLDFVQGWAVNALGHAPPELREAISRQAATLLNASPAYHTVPQGELADELSSASGLGRVFFCNSGAEANEGAIKLARKWGKIHRGGAYEIITTVNGFHGRTLATMAASGKPGWDTMFPPAISGFVKVPFGDADAVRAAIRLETVGVLVEPIQGEGGVVMPPSSYLAALRKLTTETGTLLMLDEVQTGIGRTGTLFAHQHDGVLPDVMTLGKGLGGGIPLAALVASEDAACFSPGEQGGTFNGNPLVTAAGLAVLRAVRSPGFLENVVRRGAELSRGLQKLGGEHGIVEVRGRGLLVAARLATDAAERVRDAAFELGLLVNSVRPDTLRFMPALNVSASEVEEMLALLARALHAAQ